MNKETEAIRNDLAQLAEDARALMAVTTDAAGEKVTEARRRLTDTLNRSKELCGRARDRAVEKARTIDAAVRDHPYESIAISVGVGLVAGLLLANRRPAARD